MRGFLRLRVELLIVLLPAFLTAFGCGQLNAYETLDEKGPQDCLSTIDWVTACYFFVLHRPHRMRLSGFSKAYYRRHKEGRIG